MICSVSYVWSVVVILVFIFCDNCSHEVRNRIAVVKFHLEFAFRTSCIFESFSTRHDPVWDNSSGSEKCTP